MKFVLLESRGGNYLVVAQNVAWLRAGENGQTNVGIIGGQPLLVTGSIDEVAAKILAEAGSSESPVADRPVRPDAPPTPMRAGVVESPAPTLAPKRAPEEPEYVPRLPTRPATATRPRLKAGTQRFMGMLE